MSEPTYNDSGFQMTTHISIDSKSIEYDVIEIQSRSISDPTFSDIDFKNKMAWVWFTLKNCYGPG